MDSGNWYHKDIPGCNVHNTFVIKPIHEHDGIHNYILQLTDSDINGFIIEELYNSTPR